MKHSGWTLCTIISHTLKGHFSFRKLLFIQFKVGLTFYSIFSTLLKSIISSQLVLLAGPLRALHGRHGLHHPPGTFKELAKSKMAIHVRLSTQRLLSPVHCNFNMKSIPVVVIGTGRPARWKPRRCSMHKTQRKERHLSRSQVRCWRHGTRSKTT